jgi:hypothetical protein
MTDIRYLKNTSEMVGQLLEEVGEELKNGQEIMHLNVDKNPDSSVDTITVDFQ